MARPAPKILLETILGKTWKKITIVATPAYYVVVYKGRPFNLITDIVDSIEEHGKKYPKVGFANKGHAVGLARKLNHWFECEDFTVLEVM